MIYGNVVVVAVVVVVVVVGVVVVVATCNMYMILGMKGVGSI